MSKQRISYQFNGFKSFVKLVFFCFVFIGLTFYQPEIKVYADAVTVPETAYTTTGTTELTITGINTAWLDSLTPDSDGMTRIIIDIPQSIGGIPVVGIGANAFSTGTYTSSYPNLRITSINLANATSLKSIGKSGFFNHSGSTVTSSLYSELSVTSFVLPDSITSFGYEAFSRQSGLQGALVMPDNLVSITAYNVFYGCTGFTSIDLNNVKNISADSIFSQCTSVESIDLGGVITLSGGSIFSSCISLKGPLTIPNTVTVLGGTAAPNTFHSCGTAGDGFELLFASGTSLKDIPVQTFTRAKLIGDLVIPEGIETIGNLAFQETKISSVTFPTTIKSIGNSAFNGSSSGDDFSRLTTINFPDALSHIDGLTLGNSVFQNNIAPVIIIPDYIISMGSQTFYSSHSVATSLVRTIYLNLPSSVTINTNTFTGTSSSSVIIASSKTEYDGWYAKAFPTNVRNLFTYEIEVDFYDPDTDLEINGLDAVTKLYNKNILYAKDSATLAWTVGTVLGLPAVPGAYSNADGWSFTKGGTVIRADKGVFTVTGAMLYPSSSPVNEYIWFGEYQQTLLVGVTNDTDPALNGLLENVDYIKVDLNNNGEYYYFLIEPIRWRIIDVDGYTYRLISESILDAQPFDSSSTTGYVDWQDSTIRGWLNSTGSNAGSGFYDSAFATADKTLIVPTTLYDMGTVDNVYLIAYSSTDSRDVTSGIFADNVDRIPDILSNNGQDVTYAYMRMRSIAIGSPSYYGYWWHRDRYTTVPYYVYAKDDGTIAANYATVKGSNMGVRPLITIELTSDHLLTHAGTYADPYVITLKSTASDNLSLGAMVELNGATLKAGQFGFIAKLVEDGVIQPADITGLTENQVDNYYYVAGTNGGDGNISFDAISFTTAGNYVFEMSAINGSLANIDYDNNTYYAKVTVTNNNGKLETEVKYYTDASLTNEVNNGASNTTVPVFTHQYRNTSSSGSNNPASPTNTGVDNSIVVPVMMLLVAGIFLYFGLRRKHDKVD